METADILKLSGALVGTIALTLAWIHWSGQQRVERTISRSMSVAFRLTAVHAILIFVFCLHGPVGTYAYLIVTAVVYAIAAMVSMESGDEVIPLGIGSGAGGFIEAVVGAGILLPIYIVMYGLKQFVLGFPDRELVVLRAQAVADKTHHPPPIKSETGTVVVVLRPMGRIELAGEEFDAASARGTIIEVGTPIRVCGNRGTVYLVREVQAGTENGR